MGYDINAVDSVTKNRINEADYAMYFGANIWTMRVLRLAMLEAGMAYESAEPTAKEWSALTEYTDDEWDAINEWEAPYPPDHIELLARHPDGGTGIPLHKLSSNDEWLITPAEIEQALSAWRAYESRHNQIPPSVVLLDNLWASWIAYLERVQPLGGCEVI